MNLPFMSLFPEIARAETRSATITASSPIRAEVRPPPDDYGFLEHYCTDPNCDCQRVVLSVISRSLGKPVATISHSFDRPRPGSLIPEQTFLEPMGKQSPFSEGLLAVFLDPVLDAEYADRLRRHYRLVKQKFAVAGPSGIGAVGQNRAARRAAQRGRPNRW
jgi:hypothetical protein